CLTRKAGNSNIRDPIVPIDPEVPVIVIVTANAHDALQIDCCPGDFKGKRLVMSFALDDYLNLRARFSLNFLDRLVRGHVLGFNPLGFLERFAFGVYELNDCGDKIPRFESGMVRWASLERRDDFQAAAVFIRLDRNPDATELARRFLSK